MSTLRQLGVYGLLGKFAKVRRATISIVTSVRPFVRLHEELGSHSKEFIKYDICGFLENLSRNF